MRRISEALYSVTLTLWVGGLWAVGGLVAPTLFATLSNRPLAGMIAGKLFAVLGWVGLACAAYLLIFILVREGRSALKRRVFWIVLAMLALTAAGQFGVHPLLSRLKSEALPSEVMDSVLRDRFVAWHGISSVLYLLQSVLGLLLVIGPDRRVK
ncbi:DUF4149 domain-containing protein [Propionivibrio sp.]|uniref:DUF4149 domain-containing protein n=1 Tax=Propionivibrio sp. TaxID=2212460 RepID=UPI0025EB241D|nr:DUF4149 domain-containing protein [Propionivibrio sp.]MBK7356140.1 DUF4149 domain-containing protein [Propionivibrio sp.]MBK8400195.1 DUF4149 domain-containing protein [Propionivibrio sp.]MBK8746087.1 DUF4149 domain-containing protein [Propionivibrio sp.]MBK8894376.1 DUF4149 domain-containing protein [Propionivibrio sp.]MBL0208016.1 DUF4149 domain-containing protein [Propionivibrio sp.]